MAAVENSLIALSTRIDDLLPEIRHEKHLLKMVRAAKYLLNVCVHIS